MLEHAGTPGTLPNRFRELGAVVVGDLRVFGKVSGVIKGVLRACRKFWGFLEVCERSFMVNTRSWICSREFHTLFVVDL